jgi:hypothetical protein
MSSHARPAVGAFLALFYVPSHRRVAAFWHGSQGRGSRCRRRVGVNPVLSEEGWFHSHYLERQRLMCYYKG